MAAELIGRCRCPLCGSDKGRLSLAKSRLPVLTCNGCNIQLFARSDVSDRLARALLVAEPAPAPALPAPESDTKPATPAPPPTPRPAPTPAPAPARPAWGFMGSTT